MIKKWSNKVFQKSSTIFNFFNLYRRLSPVYLVKGVVEIRKFEVRPANPSASGQVAGMSADCENNSHQMQAYFALTAQMIRARTNPPHQFTGQLWDSTKLSEKYVNRLLSHIKLPSEFTKEMISSHAKISPSRVLA